MGDSLLWVGLDGTEVEVVGRECLNGLDVGEVDIVFFWEGALWKVDSRVR